MAARPDTTTFPEAVEALETSAGFGQDRNLTDSVEDPTAPARPTPDTADDLVGSQPTSGADVPPAAETKGNGRQRPAEAAPPGAAPLRPRPAWATWPDFRTAIARAEQLRRDVAHLAATGSPDDGRGTASTSGAEASQEPEQLSLSQQARHLPEQGDLLGLLASIESAPVRDVTALTLQQIAGCVRRMAQENIDALTDALFAIIMAMAGDLLVRCRVIITQEIAITDATGRRLPDLPALLVEQGWLKRFEMLSRFVAEMATVRNRIRHVNSLSELAPRSGRRRSPGSSASPEGMDMALVMELHKAQRNGQHRQTTEPFEFP
ncbi:MAG: hypothetical protein V2A79_18540 [Planctomycetota bacterium]